MSVRNHFIQTVAIDAEWFLALKAIKRPLVLRSLTPDSVLLAREKEKAFADSSYNPTFSYPHLDGMQIRNAYSQLLQLRELVCQKETNTSIRTVYAERLTELMQEQQLLLATLEQDWSLFEQCNRQVYGSMNPQFVAEQLSVLQSRYTLFEVCTLPPVVGTSAPSPLDFETLRQILRGPDIVADPDTLYTSSAIIEAWNVELSRTIPGWSAVIDPSVVQMLVDHTSRQVSIPADISMKAKKMRKLFVHEIGTHVYRREQGKQSRLQLGSIGLAGYQSAEEGLAIMRAQLVSKRFYQFGGLDKYLVLALATGLVDGVAKDFSATFQFLEKYYTERLIRVGKAGLVATVAKNRAWNSTVRVFRGGNPALPGMCFMRDKLYHEGNRAMWQLGMDDPERLIGALTAKFDPGNAVQSAVIREYTLLQ